MVIKIFNHETGKQINRIEVSKVKDYRDVLRTVMNMQESEDVLDIGKACRLVREGFGLGIKTMYQREFVHSSRPINADEGPLTTHEGDGSFILSSYNGKEKPAEIYTLKYYDENNQVVDTGRIVDVVVYPQGFVIDMGYEDTNFLGGKIRRHLTSIGKRKWTSASKSGAKVFASPEKMLAWCQNHERELKCIASTTPSNFSIGYTCSEFEADIEQLSDKKKQKILDGIKTMNEWFDQVCDTNESEDSNEEENLPEIADEKALFDEALSRMKDMRLWDVVVDNFRNKNKVQMSEGPGIIYDLNERAKEVLKQFNEEFPGYLAYHMIHNRCRDCDGDIFDILAVSPNAAEAWKYERYNKKTRIISSYCYSDYDYGSITVGDIGVECCSSGGLMRIS